MIQDIPTLEDVLKYEEDLIGAVEKQVDSAQSPNAKAILLRLQVLLKSRVVRTFVEHLNERKFSLSSMKKIQEIDDALDELRVLELNLTKTKKRFILEQGKKERAGKITMMAILLGLFGFEWVE